MQMPERMSTNFAKNKSPIMITIPEGEFYMGTSNDQIYHLFNRADWAQDWLDKDLFLVEQPYHTVNLPAFEIARFPITNQEYHQFVWDSGYRAPRAWFGLHFPSDQENNPVAGVSRKDSLEYIKWLNKTLGQNYRLPNEGEWEKAARGLDGRIYPWGNEFDPWRCNSAESGKHKTSPIGGYSPGGDSQYGVSDVIGNVWEWTSSYLVPYPFNPEEPADKSNLRCVVRGGAWYYSQKMARCACREGVLPEYVSNNLGFRLARSIV
jgi:formylglycine-generating enzyme required for sulfatase activity